MKIVWLEFDHQGNFQMLLSYYQFITKCYRNSIKIEIEHICNCFMLSNVDDIEFNGGTYIELCFSPRIQLIFDRIFLVFPTELSSRLW